jgi:proline iminopeptidase
MLSPRVLLPIGALLLLLLGTAAQCPPPAAEVPSAERATGLYPEIEPFDSGHLEVGEGHAVFYERCGNPEGIPVLVLHGGPGVGSYPRLRRYFDPEVYHVVLHDQRGSGRSTPKGELRGNTTPALVGDIEALRTHLGLGEVVVFGGSWGSTLALAYAQTHPETVRAMVLRGIFLGDEAVIDNHYHEDGASLYFPEEFQRLLDALPDPGRRPIPEYVLEIAQGEDRELSGKVLDALVRYEMKMGRLEMPDEAIEGFLASLNEEDFRATYLIDLAYVAAGYFLEEGQLLRDAHRIAHIPTTIVNGRYDVICPPEAAWRLHRALPESELVIVERAGHSEGEPGTTAALVEAMDRLAGRLSTE